MKRIMPFTSRITLVFILLLQSGVFAQTWNPDAITSTYTYLKKENGKYRLVRSLGDGTKDSLSTTYDLIYRYNDYLMKPGYVGRKDTVWYLLDFDKQPFLIPAQKYIGQDFFLVNNGKTFSVYSIKEKKIIIENITHYNTYLADSLIMDSTSNEIPYYKLNTNSSYTQLLDGHIFWVRNSDKITYWLSEYGYFNMKNVSVFRKKSGAKSLYGLQVVAYENSVYENKVIIPPVYDSIFDYGQFTFAKKGRKYDAYNSLMMKVAADLDDYFCFTGDDGLMSVRIDGKIGLRTLLGTEVLRPVFDSLVIDRLIVAQKNDSMFFYEPGKLLKSIPKKKGANYAVDGGYLFSPFYIYEYYAGSSKTFFLYNPYKNNILNTSMYEDVFLFDIQNGNYLLTAKKNNKYGVIDLNNKVILPFEYEYISLGLMEDYWSGGRFFVVTKNGKTGFINSETKEIVPIVYDGIGILDVNSRMIPEKISLKRDKLYYLYNWKTKKLSEYGYDTLVVGKYVHSSWGQKQAGFLGTQNGVVYMVDTTGKKIFDFNNIEAKENGAYVVLEYKSFNNKLVNICPLASINRCEELNKEHHYAIVFCLNRYFVVNKYGEMSTPFEGYPEIYHHDHQLFFGAKTKKQVGLFDMKGNEVGKLSKYKVAYPEYDMKTNECYYIFQDSKKKKGVMNMKGELLLECKYADIGSITDGKCMVWPTTKTQEEVDLKKLVPLKWEK
ncbi:MAG: WG repeat-containing protein [Bacteroidota bacterium]|nr:WG repeat-containing protein [Bacteroidota bacterium]